MDVQAQWTRLVALVAGAGLAVGGAACFSPRFENCAVFCGAEGECPEDQFCLSDGRCHESQEEDLCTTGGGSDGSLLSDGSVVGEDGGGGRPDAGDGGGGVPDAGDIDAGVPINPTSPGDLVITEIHKDPDGVLDEVGEWFEIHNPTSSTFDLNELIVRDESNPVQQFGVPADIIVAPGGFVVFARNSDTKLNGGVVEDVSYENIDDPPFQLANDGTDEVLIVNPSAGDVVLDRVAYDDVSFPDVPGASLSLDPDNTDAGENDDGVSWCSGQTPYGNAGNFGTPGAPNPQCP